MSEVDELVVSFIANVNVNDEKSNEIAVKLTDLIQNKKIKLLQIILTLKERFISDDEKERIKALKCLSSILCNVEPQLLLKNDITVLINFYMSKITDLPLMKEVLMGLDALMTMKYITIDQTVTVLSFLEKNYISKDFLAAVRNYPFSILKNIYERWKMILNEDDENNKNYKNFIILFIKTYIVIASGEKDPRNLLISFQLNKIITINFKLESIQFSQALFDILFSYFPITFKPPKDDPYKISNLDLKLALRSAISASDIFAEDAFSNLIDKLGATSPAIKNDTLLTLLECINKFGGKACIEFWLQMWNALKFEIIHSGDGSEATYLDPIAQNDNSNNSSAPVSNIQSNYQLSLDVLRALADQLVLLDETAFNKYVNHILEELKPNFEFTKDLRQSCSIMAAIGSANLIAFNKVIDLTLPLFLENTTEISKLKLMLLNLSFFLDSYIKITKHLSDNEIKLNEFIKLNHLNDSKDEILMILGMALTGNSKIEVTVRTLSVIQFTKMVKMEGYLTKEEISLIIQYITETILTDNNKNIYCACLEGLKVISQTHESLVYDVSLKELLNLLPNKFNDFILYHKEDEIIQIEVILKVILDFTTSRHILIKESIVTLTQKLVEIYATGDNEAVDYCFLLLSTIYSLFENNYPMLDDITIGDIKSQTESSIFTILNDKKKENSILLDGQNLSLLSNVLYFLNVKYKRENHELELTKYTKIFVDDHKILEAPNVLVVPYVKILSAIDKVCDFPRASDIMEKIASLIHNSQTNGMSNLQKIGYMELVTVMTNKWFNDEQETMIIEKYVNWEDQSTMNLEMIAWIGKGLIMKNSSHSNIILSHFLSLLKDEKIGLVVSKLFELFVMDISSLTKHKGITWTNNVKLLYKQKFFNDVFQSLVTSYNEPGLSLDIKCNYLTALSLILKHTPNKLVEQFMNDLLPMLLQALEMPNSEVRISALDTLKDTTEKFGLLITENIDTLLPILLKLVIPGSKYNNVSVRLMSLQLIGLLANSVPLNYLKPYKEQVINGLLLTLSDKKRIVRKQCIDTRQLYFELGQVPFE
ncbi:similar to Saccharomyces cerevisiae YIL128W MET18 DNA repair and TFIIH regulator, required for both nucleotide excision repair (NER) and RNA polymerase II (RNAP II) transcription [Maudiozyma saulgeensis]|uniref:MMS19 nucleotide excision repair protein n=1 Tax=Maudiozyma saulgeensis TaxID=1789683 RepID=A0A1X7R056_9SACH|nr:similar to Saccharomyces cerevisiae YIL128W MET18 DNA repair and TFIIH regulator, required for both nucleotide excision repair (NER) and RNA polymerase II (RNAP II) transcription [Kazachstania saulgeensis]